MSEFETNFPHLRSYSRNILNSLINLAPNKNQEQLIPHKMISILLNFRVALKHQLGYAISVASLAIGFTVCILVFRFTQAEQTYDQSHNGFENIYRVTVNRQVDGAEFGDAVVQFPLASRLEADYSGVESVVRIFKHNDPALVQNGAVKFVEERQLFVDPNFFSFFAFSLVEGNIQTALSQPNSIVLTKKAAARYFGNKEPIGKTLVFKENYPLTVTGIVDESLIRTHIKFDMLIPLTFQSKLWTEEGNTQEIEENWFRTGPWTYVKFRDATAKHAVQNQLTEFKMKYFPEAYRESFKLGLQPLADIHISSHYDTEIEPNISDTYLRVFLYIIGAILLFSAINFINLNTSILLNRGKEFSVKGILGSSKRVLFWEIFSATFSAAFLSLVIAWLLSFVLQSPFNILMEVELASISLQDWTLILISLACVVVVSVIGSLQPFLAMMSGSRLSVIHDKKGIRRSLRKVAIGAQIVCSFVLVLGTMVIFKQMGFLTNFKLGFGKENILALPARPAVTNHYEAFKNKIRTIKGIENVTWTSNAPGTGGTLNYRFVPEGLEVDTPLLIPFVQADYDFIETMEIKMKDGREFDPSVPGDLGQTYIVNQAFLESVNWRRDYLGKVLRMYKPGTQDLEYTGKIIGTFEDFHTESLHFPTKPLVIALRHTGAKPGYILIKSRSMDTETITEIEKVWKSFDQEWPFEFKHFNKELDKLYANEDKLFSLTMILSVLAILISFFGLFGMNSISVMKKYKAVAIKKVLGAHAGTIFSEVMKSEIVFLALVTIVAAPIGYFVIVNWLDKFPYRIEVSFVEFLQTLGLITALVFVTLLYHVYKMTQTNPLEHISRE
jgi:putative ABC transport system permease protein